MTENYVMDELFEIADSGRIGHRTTNTDNAQPSEFASKSQVCCIPIHFYKSGSIGRKSVIVNGIKEFESASNSLVYLKIPSTGKKKRKWTGMQAEQYPDSRPQNLYT
jgi:hypothetical protein